MSCLTDWHQEESRQRIPGRWHVYAWPGETFVDALVRSLSIEELSDVKKKLEDAIARPGRIKRHSLQGAAFYVLYGAAESIPGIMKGRGLRHGDWCGSYDTRYITAKWQYQMVLDAVCEALSLKTSVA